MARKTTRPYRALRGVRHDKAYAAGDVVELTDDEAKDLLALGAVELSDGEDAEPAEPTTTELFQELVGPRAYAALEANGFSTFQTLHLATDDALGALKNVGDATVTKIRGFLTEHSETLGLHLLDAAIDARVAAAKEAEAGD